MEFRYDTQLLIEGKNLDEDAINNYFVENFKGDCLLAVGDENLIKIHYHTNEPWKVLEYCASLGDDVSRRRLFPSPSNRSIRYSLIS
ncbi:kinase to dihydroxyacetone kinase [uncultured Ligilactobacillus sp.]|uniref:kinase to dihydroxyacetone kinase n=1 Tax=uncultured Ligilactobacillus sp. TaxID=2837633 RepID=UPI00272B0087|nr:kinase to dihydroxyacetone kinase [uncultured Ligilactobacillus sp.]